jgi:acetyltransferase
MHALNARPLPRQGKLSGGTIGMQWSQRREGAVLGQLAPDWNRGSARISGEMVIRTAQPSDAAGVQRFVRGLSRETRRRRFFAPIHELSPDQLERLTSTATPDNLNLLVLHCGGEIIGMGQCAATGGGTAEFAVVVADDWQRRGIGSTLLRLLLEHARSRRLASLAGFVLSENEAMLGLAATLGLSLVRDADPSLVRVEIALNGALSSSRTSRLPHSTQAA